MKAFPNLSISEAFANFSTMLAVPGDWRGGGCQNYDEAYSKGGGEGSFLISKGGCFMIPREGERDAF